MGEHGGGKRKKYDEDQHLTQEERLKKSTAPYWNIPYSEQVCALSNLSSILKFVFFNGVYCLLQQNLKREDMRKLLLEFGHELLRVNSDLGEWLKKQRAENDGLPCPLLDIRSSSIINGYRNKCEFSIGLNPETRKVTVGFRLGSYADGSVGVGPLDGMPHVPDRMKEVAKVWLHFPFSISSFGF